MPNVMKRCQRLTRRSWLAGAASMVAASRLVPSPVLRAGSLPSSPVAVARCRRYDYDVVKTTLAGLFDQLGGIGTLVGNKTVTVKVNITGGWHTPVYTLSPLETVYTHPAVALAACSLIHEAGARRIILCESLYSRQEVRSVYQESGYPVADFESTVPTIEWENTRNLGSGQDYKELPVGPGAYLYDKFLLNHRYVDTDVLVSIPKMKNHDTAGITLAMKNLFGITPSSLYATEVHNENSTSARIAVLHEGVLSPAGGEVLPVPSTLPGFRVPRVVVDIVRARPIDLSIIDGIVTMHGGEGAWHGTSLGILAPSLLIAGKNSVCTDAVTTAIMGYDPEAPAGNKPFYNGDNTLTLAADRGLGTCRLSEIEVRGLSIPEARYDFLPSMRR
jgi:uncharacterized protein (DUF362 family)